MKKITAREKIIIATIECIEKKGINSVTVRDIAKQAEVNVAAVNYYFGTKEKLLDEALKFTLYSTLTENIEEFESKDRDTHLMMKDIFKDIFQGALKFPNLTKSHIYGPIINNDYSGVFVQWLNDYLTKLTEKLKKVGLPNSYNEALKISVVQMMSAFLFWSLMPNMFDKFLGIDFHDVQKQEEYIDILLKHYSDTIRKTER